jgi:hypothetical protein
MRYINNTCEFDICEGVISTLIARNDSAVHVCVRLRSFAFVEGFVAFVEGFVAFVEGGYLRLESFQSEGCLLAISAV